MSATTNDDALIMCEVCNEHPATDAVRDVNGGGPWIDVCVVCAESPWEDDGDDDEDDGGAVVTDDVEVARVLEADADANVIATIESADGVQHASIVGGERDGEVYVVTSNIYGQTLVYVFRTLDGARTYYDAVTTDYERND